MILAAHAIATSCYLGAAVIAAAPFARPVRAPVTGVALALAAGLVAHATGILAQARDGGATAVARLGPSLSFAGLAVAATRRFPLFAVQRDSLEQFSRTLMNKFLHAPSVRLREAAGNGRGLGVVDAASHLFGVEDAVQREPKVSEAQSHTDTGRNFRITNPGTDE